MKIRYPLFLLCLLFLPALFSSKASAQEIPAYSSRYYEHPVGLSEKNPNAESRASRERSDTIDILHITINLDMTEMGNAQVSGNCQLDFSVMKNGVDQILLDLLSLTVDSVTTAGNNLSFAYDDTLLTVDLANTMDSGQTGSVTVHYHGSPVGDDSGWGGFYFSGNYAFNLGVGFAADPHNYGRVWYPCFDNFVERSTYDFNITTAGGKRASCNGLLTGQTPLNGDTMVWHWSMDQTIPSYLSCIAVGDYVTVDQVHNGIQGAVPIQLHAAAGDTTDLKNSFANLGAAISAFENRFGPYSFDKVGFSLVPFGSGAMEHATNIAYPISSANGNLSSERLMAHELAHMWFGDLVTCSTAEDMWLNEGWASFCEFIFLEEVYGREEYIDQVNADHVDLLRTLHIEEEGFRAVSGVPHEYTYGSHVYTKGSLMAHTLRGYMGDADFFSGLQDYLANNSFEDASSSDFRDALAASTGQNLDDFFNDWVFGPGWPHFAIDSFTVEPTTGLNKVKVYIHQKLRGAPNYFNNVPFQIRFMDANQNESVLNLTVSGEYSEIEFDMPIVPVYADLDPNYLISHAVSGHQVTINSTGFVQVPRAVMNNFNVGTISDSAFLRVQHHWVAADPVKTPASINMRTSPDRYWSIQGFVPQDFSATARITYDGEWNNQYDPLLFEMDTEDSLFLLYREHPGKEWRIYEHYTKNVLSDVNDHFGVIDLSEVLLGEYCFGIQDQTVGLEENVLTHPPLRVFPNPASDRVYFDLSAWKGELVNLELLNIMGQQVVQKSFLPGSPQFLQTDHLAAGTYIYRVNQSGKVATGLVQISF